MKNILNTSVYFLTFSFLLISCIEQTSTKGKWSSSDMKKCTQEAYDGIKEEEGVEEMMSLAGISFDEFITCVCEKLEENYDSYSIAEDEMDEATDEEAGMMMLSCLGNLENLENLLNQE